MDFIKLYLKEIVIVCVWVLIIYFIFRRIFGKKVYGQYSDEILKYETDDFILTGKPDRVLEKFGNLIIYEYKSGKTPKKPYEDHVIQLGAYFILFEETNKKRPDFGIIKYNEKEFRIENTDELKNKVLNLIQDYLKQTSHPEFIRRNHNNYGKCHHCRFRSECKQSLVLNKVPAHDI
ncbi:MAG: PD-(D/E)XK nuclease family protein [bacterium]|nr:PD-(D/E)XK nuclease family protein [bacterium]